MHPVAIELGPIAIHWYGVLVALGFLAAMWTASFRARTVGIRTETIMDLGIWMIVAGILGARIFYVVGHWEEFTSNPIEIIRVDHGGLVFYGGFIGAALASILFVKRKKLDYWKLADAVAPSIALGHAFGRMGCFMNGCCFGKACSLPWAVHFPVEHETHGVGVHPTQIYEAIGNLAIFAALHWFYPKRRFDGEVFWLYVLSYGVLRFADEFFRGDYRVHFLHGLLAPGQVTAIVLIVVALVFLWRLPPKEVAR